MRKVLALVLLLIFSLSLFTACGGKGKSGGKVVVGASLTSVNAGFWSSNRDGIFDKAEEHGCEVVLLVSEGDANKQNDQIRSLISQKVDVILIAVTDGSANAAAVREAQAAGIPCVMDVRPLQSDDVEAEMTVLFEDEVIAYEQMIWLAEKGRKEGVVYNIVLLIGSLGDEGAVLRYNGNKRAVTENPDVLNVVAEIPTDWKVEAAFAGVQNSMQAFDDVNCIMCFSDYFITPIQSALEQINRWKPIGESDHVTLLTYDGDSNAMKGLESGYIDCTVIQDCYLMGYKSLDWAVRIANGEKPPSSKQEYVAGVLATQENFDEIKDGLWGWKVYQAGN